MRRGPRRWPPVTASLLRSGYSAEVPVPFSQRLGAPVAWAATGDAFVPWLAVVGREEWALRLGEFPVEALYTLYVDGLAQGELDDWPAVWSKVGRAPAFPWSWIVALEARALAAPPTRAFPVSYRFACALSAEEIVARLGAAGPFDWSVRDSDDYGDYAIARPAPGVRLRIVGAAPSWMIDLQLAPDAPTSATVFDVVVRERILATLGARDVEVTPAL